MITYITGVPGSGKTLNTIKLVRDEWGDSDRTIYYAGINELTLDWTQISYEDVTRWTEYPPGSIFVIDEAYNSFPRRTHSKEAPQFVKDLATHRHKGYDFYIITQKHTSVDHGVREHVNRHFHYERAFGLDSCRQFEWTKSVDPEDYHAREQAIVKRIRFDKSIYNLYKSAEVHTFKKKLPTKVWFVAAGFLACVVLAVSIATRDRSFVPDPEEGESYSNYLPTSFGGRSQDKVISPEEYAEKWKARIPDVPHSAPAYDEVTEVKTFPRPQCIEALERRSCYCYTQQATPLQISTEMCLRIVNSGWFNPFIDEEEDRDREERESRRRERTSPRAASLGHRLRQRESDYPPNTTIIGTESNYTDNRRLVPRGASNDYWER